MACLPHPPTQQAETDAADQARRWRLAVLTGLVVAPFFPASNVLFYVGTFIGERLMYFPSGAQLRLVVNCSLLGPTACCRHCLVLF